MHTTTNILVTLLAEKCITPFAPATLDVTGKLLTPASAECRTSNIALAEFKTLRGKMDAFDAGAFTPAEYVDGTANWRTDLFSGPSSGTLLTHRENIALFKRMRIKMTPELKSTTVRMPFGGFTQAAYAQMMIDEYKAAGVPARYVWPQSLSIRDVLYWVNNEAALGEQAVYLDDARTVADLPTYEELMQYKSQAIQIVAPPTFALLAVDARGRIAPSDFARNAKRVGLGIITWTLERSGILADGNNGFYYQTIDAAIKTEGDMMQVIKVLARDVGVLGIFSNWPATTTCYADCTGLR